MFGVQEEIAQCVGSRRYRNPAPAMVALVGKIGVDLFQGYAA